MSSKLKRHIEITGDKQDLEKRLWSWASANNFICTDDSEKHLVFSRLSRLRDTVIIDINKLPTIMTIEIGDKSPFNILCTVECRKSFNTHIPNETDKLGEQLDLLESFLKGELHNAKS